MATLPPKAAGSGRLPLKFLALSALALLYFFLAGRHSLWHDEVMSVRAVQAEDLISSLAADLHPPL